MKKKPWTILFYLNGNNELGMEMEKTFFQLKSVNFGDNVYMAVEIGKAPCKLVNLIRNNHEEYKEPWTGIRRYGIHHGEIILEEQCDEANMADYMNLYRFIEWGMGEFPAERYMLCISGHGFMVEVLTDLTGDVPCTMGLYEMCLAINMVKKRLKKKIDILDLDICNMNSLEVLYELGKSASNTATHVITYINHGPLQGMDYNNILKEMDERSTEDILKTIVNESYIKLVALSIDHGKLEKMKQLCSEISYYKLNQMQHTEEVKYLQQMRKYTMEINTMAQKLIVAHNNEDKKTMILDIMCFDTNNIRNVKEFSRLYFKLSFSRNSYCSNMITFNKSKVVENIKPAKPCQEMLTRENILLFIKTYNPNMCHCQIEKIGMEIENCVKWKTTLEGI